MRLGALEAAETVKLWASLGAPEPIPARARVCGPAFTGKDMLLMALSVGASFTAVTVIDTVAAAEFARPSFARNVKLSEPKKFALGV
jgi:hypothetical protein